MLDNLHSNSSFPIFIHRNEYQGERSFFHLSLTIQPQRDFFFPFTIVLRLREYSRKFLQVSRISSKYLEGMCLPVTSSV